VRAKRALCLAGSPMSWPLHDIAITNIVWCMAYTRGSGGESYIAQYACNSIATVWGLEVGGWNEIPIASCTNDL